MVQPYNDPESQDVHLKSRLPSTKRAQQQKTTTTTTKAARNSAPKWLDLLHASQPLQPNRKGGKGLPLEGTHVSMARWKHKKMAITQKPHGIARDVGELKSDIFEQVHELRIAGCYPAARIENLSFIKERFYTRRKHKKTSTTKNHSIPTHVFTSTEKHGILLFLLASKPKKPIGAVGDTLDIGLSMRLLLYRTCRRTPRLKPMRNDEV